MSRRSSSHGPRLIRSRRPLCPWPAALASSTAASASCRSFSAARFVVYALGVPLLFYAVLYLYRDVLELRAPQQMLGFLYRDYTRKTWYFEIVELLRKLILCGATGFIAPGTLTQIVFCLVFCTV